ncbi:glycosyltransferase family 4 protein [Candidatus Parcubacteria bacterium]|jgi:glycosyltransferase involved in cell wall biosynthesis|nr:glycosyltransferase family 4 protein [Candidatus Parcubacteria bacterium]MBT3948940.1 glycosyltransferase family 4 protein [Candidatus Parcubacteria bacterium]
MKIAHIVSTYPPYFGGMGNVVFQTAGYLSGLGHEVMVLTPKYYERKEIRSEEAPEAHTHSEELQEEIDYAKRLKTPLSYGNAAYMPQVKNELDDFDIVHLHYPFFGTANMVRKWKLRNPHKPLVITYHMDTRSGGWKGLVFKYYAKYWMPRILNSADKIIASSFDYIEASDAREIFKENTDKWIELPFGVDANRFHPRELPEALFKKHGLNSELPTIVFVGGMDGAHYFKGIPILLEALLLLKKEDIDLQVVLVGDGELKEQFMFRAKGYGLKNVRFVGKVSDEELPYYYSMGDLFVLPSINRGEAFGMVLLEAMASGVPVLASNLPGVRTVAEDGGLIFGPGNAHELRDAIAGYFSKDTDQFEWKQNARGIVEEKYAWERIVERLDSVYNELVSR